MKELDFKMRERFEQKEYYPDRYGETRVDRMNNHKLERHKKEKLRSKKGVENKKEGDENDT